MGHAGLGPTSSVLDVGCGAGRLAVGIIEEIGAVAGYLGLDVRRDVISWDRRFLARRYRFLRFEHIDVANARYNAHGDETASVFTLPSPTGEVDVVYAYSVFSHMISADVSHYLTEFYRLLHPAGTAVFTAFVEPGVPDEEINPTSYGPIQWQSALHCVRFDQHYFTRMLMRAGLEIVHFGHGEETDGQSLFVAKVAAGRRRDSSRGTLLEPDPS
jgi:SAM-dependent methyltransferase